VWALCHAFHLQGWYNTCQVTATQTTFEISFLWCKTQRHWVILKFRGVGCH
jgi:hypothetical protein